MLILIKEFVCKYNFKYKPKLQLNIRVVWVAIMERFDI